jgi:hypothetical protein
MANFIAAIRKFGPRIDLNPTVPKKKLSAWIAMRTGLNESQVMMVLDELKAAVLFFNGMGSPVKLPGLGRFAPAMKRDGKLKINLQVDTELRKGINADDAFYGEVINHTHIGLDDAAYKSLWDTEYPDDPLEI